MALAGLTLPVACAITCCLLNPPQNQAPRAVPRPAADPDLRHCGEQAGVLFEQRRYNEAAGLYERGYRQALEKNQPAIAGRFLINAGACRLALFEYRSALEALSKARDITDRAGDCEGVLDASANLSSLHLMLGELEGAAVEARRAAATLADCRAASRGAAALLQWAKTEAGVQGLPVAGPIYMQALAAADREGNPRLAGQIWNSYGWDLTRAGRLKEAEEALANGFRLRLLNGRAEIESSYGMLAALRLAQGDFAGAERLAGAAIAESAARPGRAPNWYPHYWRAQARLAQGRLEAALADLREAVRVAARWRLEVLPADAHRTSLDVGFDDLYTTFAVTAAELYGRNRDPALARESFQAAEENRAASLRAIALRGRSGRLPDGYGETLARLRTLEADLLAAPDAQHEVEARRLRHQLNLMEAAAGLAAEVSEPAGPADLDVRVRNALQPFETFLSVSVGERGSFLWAVTNEGLEVHPLPPRKALQEAVRSFLGSVQTGAAPEARAFYVQLFGSLSEPVRRKRSWILALDEDLFEAPLGAAVADGGSFLLEQHAVRIVPSAHFLLRRSGPGVPAGPLLAVADPIYNRADERLARRLPATALELPRLAASGAEVRACARAWSRGPAVLLEGAAANRRSISAALAQHPPVVHFATHFIAPPGRPDQVHLALALSDRGEPELLTAADIAASDCRGAVIVLNGCGSARGQIGRGPGLMGLTRAWLAAGASAVIATLWPIPDSSEALFPLFYERLSQGESAADALRAAQMAVLRKAARPRDWAAYLIIGKN